MIGITGLLLREVPAAFSGPGYKVYGSIIRSVADGRIVAHLQEAGGLSKLASLFSTGPLAPLRLVADGFQIAHNEQIKAGIAELGIAVGTLQQFAVANLALGAAGIGVSITGFAMLNRKIDALGGTLRGLDEKLEALASSVGEVREELLAVDLDDLRWVARLYDEGWRDAATLGERRWHKVAEEAPRLAERWQRRTASLLASSPATLVAAEPVLDALTLANALEFASRVALGEARAARMTAEAACTRLDALTGRLGLMDLVRVKLAHWKPVVATAGWNDALVLATEQSRPFALRLREREAAAATRAAFLDTLENRNVHPRDYLEACRMADDTALIILPA